MRLLFTAGIAALILLISGCGGGEEESRREKEVTLGRFDFSNAWVRPGAEGGNSAAYLRITNGTAANDTLTEISSEASERASLHEAIEKDGVTEMHVVDDLSVASGSSMSLEPGGKHIMLIELNRELTEGDSVGVTLEFLRAGKQEVSLPVRLQE